MVQLERSPQGSLGLSLAGHRDRNTMAVFVVGINPNGVAHRLGTAGVQVGDEILEVNIVLHPNSHKPMDPSFEMWRNFFFFFFLLKSNGQDLI